MENIDKEPQISPYIAILGGILAISTASIFIRYAQEEAASIVVAAYRLGIAALVLAPIAFIRYREELKNLRRREVWLALISGLFLAIHFASWITSLEYTSIANSVVLVTTTPLWVALLAPLVLQEQISRLVVIGLVITLLGGTLIGLGDACTWEAGLRCPTMGDIFSGQAIWGDLLALVGAWMAAGYFMVGRKLRKAMSLVTYIFLVYTAAAVILFVWVWLSPHPLVGYSPRSYLWFLLLALIPQIMGHSVFNWALRYLPASIVSITLVGEPIGSVILAYLILRETPTEITLIGAVLILSGIYIASRSSQRNNVLAGDAPG